MVCINLELDVCEVSIDIGGNLTCLLIKLVLQLTRVLSYEIFHFIHLLLKFVEPFIYLQSIV